MIRFRSLGVFVALSFALAPSAPSQTQFQERSLALGLVHETTVGLDRVGQLKNMLDWVQTGAAMGDLDGNGWPDLIVCGRFEGTRLFMNQGGFFTDSTATSGLASDELDNSVTLGDYDGDGDLDAFIGVHGPLEGPITSRDRLLRNDGNAHFEVVTGALDTSGGGHTIFAKFFDLDYDGDLDLYSCQFNGTPNQLHVNNGDGTFTERGAALGADIGGSTHVVGIADVDGDGFVDLLVGNDFMVSAAAQMVSNTGDIHLQNTGDGHFVDVTAGAGFDLVGSFGATTMGLTFGDVNYDGKLDIYRSEYGPQILSLNNGWPNGGPWVEAQDDFGVASPQVPNPQVPGTTGHTVGWGTKFLNADHDLWLDLFELTGHISIGDPRQQRSFLFSGLGPSQQFHFEDTTQQAGLYEEIDDRSLCVGDPDQDGDLDFLIIPAAGPIRFFENSASESAEGWLEVRVETHTSAPGGFGTLVSFTDSLGYPHVVPISADGATASHHEALAHFGLGQEQAVDVSVAFPSGLTRVLPGVRPNQSLTVVEPELIRLSKSNLPSLQAGGAKPLVVTAFAHDAAGQPLAQGARVAIDAQGLLPMGPVVHVGGNEYRRVFAPAAFPSDHRVAVTFNGWTPRIRPTVSFLGEVSATRTSVHLEPDCVRAGSADSFEVTVTPRDARGLALGPGRSVFCMLPGPGGIAPTQLVDAGDGRYVGWLPAPQQTGALQPSITISVPAGLLLLQSQALLESAQAASGPDSDFYEEVPQVHFAASPSQLKFRVTPRDAAGLRLGSAGTVDITLAPVVGSTLVIERTDLRKAHVDGTFDFVLERGPKYPPHSGVGTLTVWLDGVALYSQPYSF